MEPVPPEQKETQPQQPAQPAAEPEKAPETPAKLPPVQVRKVNEYRTEVGHLDLPDEEVPYTYRGVYLRPTWFDDEQFEQGVKTIRDSIEHYARGPYKAVIDNDFNHLKLSRRLTPEELGPQASTKTLTPEDSARGRSSSSGRGMAVITMPSTPWSAIRVCANAENVCISSG